MRLAALSVGLVLAMAASLSAQEVTGGLEGRVLTPDGTPLSLVAITVTSPSLQGQRTVTTDQRGKFQVPALPPGAYGVAIRRLGYGPVRYQGVQVHLGATTTLGDIRLEARAVEFPEIVVSGVRPVIDPVSPATGATLNASQILSLPSDRNFRSLMAFVPQANPSFHGTGVNVGGSTGLENAFFVDGTNVTVGAGSSVDLPFNFVREIQVTTGGYEAEFGRALSGVINVVTPSGGNKFHGQMLGFFTGDALRTVPKVGLNETDVARFSRYDLGVSLSGPLRKDRLWYFAAYNPTFAKQRESVGALPDQQGSEVQHLFAGKLTWRARAGTDVAVTLLGDPTRSNSLAGVLPLTTDPGTALTRGSSGGTTVALTVRHEIDRRTLLQVAVSRLVRRSDRGPRSGATDLAAITRLQDLTANTSFGGPGMVGHDRETRTALRTGVTLWRGAHTLKAGAEYEANAFSPDFQVSSVTRHSASLYQWNQFGLTAEVHNRVPTLYAQDVWEVTPRLRLSGGLRWESQHMSGREGPDRTVAMELAPRLGLVYQLGEPGTARLFASAGRFYEQVLPIAVMWWNGVGGVLVRHFPQNPLLDPSNPDTLVSFDIGKVPATPDLVGQSYDQFSVGYERRVGTAYKVGARGTYRILRWVIDDGDPGNGVYTMGNPGRGALAAMPRARQRYAAFELSLERATPGPLYLLASYVLSRNVGNYTGLHATDQGSFGPLPNSGPLYDVPDLMNNAYGPLPNDQTHFAKAAASYRFGAGVTLGGFLTVASGTPLSEAGTSAYGGGYQTFVQARGSEGRTPTIWSLDLRAAYDLPVGRGGRVRPKLLIDVFNVGAPRQAAQYEQLHYFDAARTEVNPNYGAVTKYQPPMSARVGMVVDF